VSLDPVLSLDREWQQLARGVVPARLRLWAEREPALAPFVDPARLVEFVRGSASSAMKDELLRPLVRLAFDDPLAARVVLQVLLPGLKRIAGRALHDLPGAPRPDPDAPAPVRFLPAFDSVQLAYAARRRQRFLPDAYGELIYLPKNLQVLPAVLVDGMVAGTWAVRAQRRQATLSLRLFARLPRPAHGAVLEEAERLVRFSQPAARAHAVEVAAD